MGAEAHISKWGGSLAVRIPRSIAEQWGVEAGSAIEMVSRGDVLVLRKRAYDLTGMLSSVEPGNLHPEVDTGPGIARERW